MTESLPGTDDVTSPWYPWQDEETWRRAQELRSSPPPPPQPMPPVLSVGAASVSMETSSGWVDVGRIRDAVLHTEIIESEQGDLVASPGQLWLMSERPPQEISWEITVTEEQFWRVVAAVYGPEVVVEMKQELEAVLAWEGEGGSCTQD